MVIHDVQHRWSPPLGRLHLRRRQDTSTREVKEEPEDVKLPTDAISAGFVVPSPLQDELHDDDFPGMSWALVEVATKIEKECPGTWRPRSIGAYGLGLHLRQRILHSPG